MPAEVLTPDVFERVCKLAAGPVHPKIKKLKDEIDSETRIMMLRASVGLGVSDADIDKIVKMKLELDQMYMAWAKGDL